jgi:hypothetical protein
MSINVQMNKNKRPAIEWGEYCAFCNKPLRTMTDAYFNSVFITRISTIDRCYCLPFHKECFESHVAGEEYSPHCISGSISQYYCHNCYDPVSAGSDSVRIELKEFSPYSTLYDTTNFIIFHDSCFLQLSGKEFFEEYYEKF